MLTEILFFQARLVILSAIIVAPRSPLKIEIMTPPPQATVPPIVRAVGGTRIVITQTLMAFTWTAKITTREWCGITGKTIINLLRGLRWKSVQNSSKVHHTLLVWTKRWICAQQIHKVSCALVLKVKFSNKLEVHVLLFKVKTADEAMKIKYFYERDVDVAKLVVPIKIKQRGKKRLLL